MHQSRALDAIEYAIEQAPTAILPMKGTNAFITPIENHYTLEEDDRILYDPRVGQTTCLQAALWAHGHRVSGNNPAIRSGRPLAPSYAGNFLEYANRDLIDAIIVHDTRKSLSKLSTSCVVV